MLTLLLLKKKCCVCIKANLKLRAALAFKTALQMNKLPIAGSAHESHCFYLCKLMFNSEPLSLKSVLRMPSLGVSTAASALMRRLGNTPGYSFIQQKLCKAHRHSETFCQRQLAHFPMRYSHNVSAGVKVWKEQVICLFLTPTEGDGRSKVYES